MSGISIWVFHSLTLAFESKNDLVFVPIVGVVLTVSHGVTQQKQEKYLMIFLLLTRKLLTVIWPANNNAE